MIFKVRCKKKKLTIQHPLLPPKKKKPKNLLHPFQTLIRFQDTFITIQSTALETHLWWVHWQKYLPRTPPTHYTLLAHSHKDAWRRVKSDDPISEITDLNLAPATGQGTCPINTDATLQHKPWFGTGILQILKQFFPFLTHQSCNPSLLHNFPFLAGGSVTQNVESSVQYVTQKSPTQTYNLGEIYIKNPTGTTERLLL